MNICYGNLCEIFDPHRGLIEGNPELSQLYQMLIGEVDVWRSEFDHYNHKEDFDNLALGAGARAQYLSLTAMFGVHHGVLIPGFNEPSRSSC